MNKVTVVLPRAKTKQLLKILKDLELKKYIKLVAGSLHKYEIFVTELQTQETVTKLKEELKIHAGKSTSEGYITVHSTNIVAPLIVEKGKKKELEEFTKIDAKKFVRIDNDYVLFTVCAALLGGLGFMINNLFVLIGAMLLSPLMSPIMAASYGLAKGNKKLVKDGLRTEFLGVALMIITSIILLLLPNNDFTLEQSFATTNPYFTLVIALVLGVVAANSFFKGQFESLTGVAVSISLVPPLVNFVLLLMTNQLLSLQSLLLFVLSILGIQFSSYVWFRMLHEEK